ncbi:MAG: hypothetical protein HY875_03010 [Chloroflexi bacterium]|nr:hypothetical protein [Chloroflexota bacterium]
MTAAGARRRAAILTAAALLMASAGFYIGRQTGRDEGARAAPDAGTVVVPGTPAGATPVVPETLPVPAAGLPDIDTTRSGWQLPYLAEWRAKPRFDQAINGITVGPTAVRTGTVCGSDVKREDVPPSAFRGTVLEISPDYLPVGGYVREDTMDEFGSAFCGGEPGVSTLTVGIRAAADAAERLAAGESWFVVPHGGFINVHKYRYRDGAAPAEFTDIPASHWYADTIGGLPAAVGRPVLDAGLGGGAVLIWDAELRVSTVIYSYNLGLEELLKFAAGVAR